MAAASGGYLFGPLSMILRVPLFCVGPLLIVPDLRTDIFGIGAIIAIVAVQLIVRRRLHPAGAMRDAGPAVGQ